MLTRIEMDLFWEALLFLLSVVLAATKTSVPVKTVASFPWFLRADDRLLRGEIGILAI